MIEKTRTDCINCRQCTKHCPFLQKYALQLKDFTYRPDLRHHCFLCGVCTQVCPKDLSGTEIALELRQKTARNNPFIGYMKNHYPFKSFPRMVRKEQNDRQKTAGHSLPQESVPKTVMHQQQPHTQQTSALLFLGCNYPGFYPKTTERLINLCKERGIPYAVDCCKKPVYEQGGTPYFTGIKKLLTRSAADTLICVCPNCYHFLKNKLPCKVISVYEFLFKNDLGSPIKDTPSVFFPCSDRTTREIFRFIQPYLNGHTEPYRHINCCGLGGGAKKYEQDMVNHIRKQLIETQNTLALTKPETNANVYTYCASCAGIFTSYGLKNVKNFLAEILDTHETVSDRYAVNIIRTAFMRRHS